MKKIFIIIITCLICTLSYSQKTKTVTISNSIANGMISISFSEYKYNGGIIKDTIVCWVAQNSKYRHINDGVVLYNKNYKNFCSFLDEIIKFREEDEDNTSNYIQGQRISLYSTMGMKGIYIYDENGTGYHSYTPKGLKKIKNKFIQWCEKNGINLL